MLGISVVLLTLVLTFGFLFRSIVTNYIARSKKIRRLGCESPRSTSQRDPIFGLDVAFRMFKSYGEGQRSAKFKEQHEMYGPTFQSTALGKTRIFTIDPGNLRAIFSTNFREWGVQPLRLPSWEPFLGRGVMNMDGAYWKHSRNIVQPLFRREQISDLASFDVHVTRFLELIPQNASQIDLQPLFARLILDFTTEFLFGESVECLTPSPNQHAMVFLEAFHYGQAAIGKRTQLPYWAVFTRDRRFWQAAKTVRNFVDEHVNRAKDARDGQGSKKRRKYILVDELVRNGEPDMDIRNQLLNTFLAAHDTTAVLMTNVFFNLARNPDMYQTLRQEVLNTDLKDISFDKIKTLQYLRNVVLETSRLTPVVGQSARIALQDTVLPIGGGYSGTSPIYVRKGTSVQFNFFALHRRRDVYGEDADVFRPERWNSLEPGSWDFLPFIGGPRVCPAQEMALLQVRFTVARVVQMFAAIESRDPVIEFVEQYRITSDSKNGCKVALFTT